MSFHYPGAEHPVLDDISFETAPGETTAIVGSTGAGKTTLLQLIPRLFDVTAGSVLLGGIDVRELDTKDLWSRIGLVPQRPYLFSGTIATNLRYGKPDATDDQMWEALEVAQAADFVRRMAGGLEARIDQGGINVSGGQRQRLAIARALVRRAGRLSLRRLLLRAGPRDRRPAAGRPPPYTANSAVLIVAQRVSTITSADRILVLEDGNWSATAPTPSCAVTCPTYAEIVPVAARRPGAGVTTVEDRRDDGPPAASNQHARWVAYGGGRSAARTLAGSPEGHTGVSPGCWVERVAPDPRHPHVRHRRHPQRARPTGAWSRHRSDRRGRSQRAHGFRQRCTTSGGGRSAFTSAPGSSPCMAAYTLAGIVQRLMQRLRSGVEDKIHGSRSATSISIAAGDLLSRVTNDIDNIAQSLQQTLSQLLNSVFLIVAVFIAMFLLSPLLAARGR